MIWNYEIKMIFLGVIIIEEVEYNIILVFIFYLINVIKFSEYIEVFVCYIMV